MTPPALSTRLNTLMQTGDKLSFKKGEPVTQTEDQKRLWMVQKGYVKRFQITNSGFISTQVIYGPGDIFSLTYAFRVLLNKRLYNGPEIYYYETMADSVLYGLPATSLLKAFEAEPSLYKDIFEVAGDRLESNIQMLENMSLKGAQKRVAHQILYFAHKWGVPLKNKQTRFSLQLTHQDIADVLSLTRETVTVCITDLKNMGLLEQSGRLLVVCDLDKLQAEAYS